MIYIQRHYKINKPNKTVVQSCTLNIDLEEGMEYAEEVLTANLVPIIYLKESGSRDLIKVQLVENQVIISYILDLFDFEKEFEN